MRSRTQKRRGTVTAVFECKQSRSDFLKDSHSADATLKRLKGLEERRRKLEGLIGMHHPSLRKGETLFEEYAAVDLSGLEHKTYRRVLREIQVLQNRLYGKTKFDKVVRYAIANLYYLVVENGILAEHEFPLPWGVLVHREGELHLARRPAWQDVADGRQTELLGQIARVNTRWLNREFGITFEAIQPGLFVNWEGPRPRGPRSPIVQRLRTAGPPLCDEQAVGGLSAS